MNKITKYINETSNEDIVVAVVKSKKDIKSVIQQIKDARTEFQRRTQELQWELEKHLGDRGE